MSMMRAALLAAGGSSAPALTPAWNTTGIGNCQVETTSTSGTRYITLSFGIGVPKNYMNIYAGATVGGPTFWKSVNFFTLSQAVQADYADYEVRADYVGGTGNHNFASVGRSLATWHNLASMQSFATNNTNSGFVWTCSGQRAGLGYINVSVRHKVETWRVTTRQFIIEQTTDLVAPVFTPFIDGASLDRQVPSLGNSSGVNNSLTLYSNNSAFLYGSASLNDDTYSASGSTLITSGYNGGDYEVRFHMDIIAGSGAFFIGGAGNNITADTWYDLSQNRIIYVTWSGTFCRVRITLDVRHKVATGLADQAIFEWGVDFS